MSNAALKIRAVAEEKKLVGPALKGFFLIMERWGIDNESARILLGAPPERTFYLWKAGQVARVPMDTLRRVGYISGIWKALEIVYSDPALAIRWIKAPNRAFGGMTPIGRMTAGDVTDLAAVRSYLDAARSPWS
jgi:hypothetical protein